MPDDATIVEGDAGFLGMASRLNPVQLQPGLCQLVENMRLDRGVAQTRRGVKRVGTNISPGTPPLILPFVLNQNAILGTSYAGGIFASGVFSSPNYNNASEYIVLCGPDAAHIWHQNETIVVASYPAAEVIDESDAVSTMQAFNEFYLLREADITAPGFGWKYTTASGIAVSDTTATVHITGHGYSANQRVRIEGSDTVPAFQGNEFDIATASTDSFTITVPTGTAPDASSGIAVRRVKPPLVWNGTGAFTRVPAGVPDTGVTYQRLRSVPWATYLNNRLWIPSGRDTVLLSDVLDANHYDPFFQSFRANQGSNDYIVAIHPWTEGQALVFMRNSIWLATLQQDFNGTDWDIDSAVSNLTLLTDEIGCVARRSIVTAGNFVFFLSDSGVYRLDTKLDIKLRGDTLPLSDPIADQLGEINPNQSHLAVGKWFNNRYHLAVCIGETATRNNTLFLWNALNQQWESRDTYSINLDELLISKFNEKRRLFAASRSGVLFLLDEMDRGDDVPHANASDAFTPVQSRLITRRYGWGSLNAKRLLRAKASVLLPPTGACTLRAVTTDYDADFQIATLSNSEADTEDYTLKAPLRCKATYLDLEFRTTADRPTLRQISAEATRSNLDPAETRTLN